MPFVTRFQAVQLVMETLGATCTYYSNKRLLGTSASLLVTSALLVVTIVAIVVPMPGAPNSFLLLVAWHLLLVAWHLFLGSKETSLSVHAFTSRNFRAASLAAVVNLKRDCSVSSQRRMQCLLRHHCSGHSLFSGMGLNKREDKANGPGRGK